MSPFRTGVVTTTERREFATPVFLFGYIKEKMNSEDALKEKIPLVTSILLNNGIVTGKYSLCAYTIGPETEFKWQVSPTKGNSFLFTTEVQTQLADAGIQFKINQ